MPTFHNQFQPRATRATVYQLRADVLCPDGMENSFSRIIGLILPFVAKSLYTKLPPEAAEHRSFEIQDENRQCECVAVPERMLWAIRFKFTSKDGTLWYYDVSLVREDDRLIFGMKIDTAFGTDVKALQAKLLLVESLLGCGLLAQGRPVTANLWLVNTPEDVSALVALLEDPYRSLPVIVISAVNRNAWRLTPSAPEYLVNAEYLANRVKGYAIVARINFQSAYALTEAVGKSWSVYDGACRTYFPKIDFDNGSPAHHPGNFKDKIWFWNYEGLRGERGYTAFLIDTAHRAAPAGPTGAAFTSCRTPEFLPPNWKWPTQCTSPTPRNGNWRCRTTSPRFSGSCRRRKMRTPTGWANWKRRPRRPNTTSRKTSRFGFGWTRSAHT